MELAGENEKSLTGVEIHFVKIQRDSARSAQVDNQIESLVNYRFARKEIVRIPAHEKQDLLGQSGQVGTQTPEIVLRFVRKIVQQIIEGGHI